MFYWRCLLSSSIYSKLNITALVFLAAQRCQKCGRKKINRSIAKRTVWLLSQSNQVSICCEMFTFDWMARAALCAFDAILIWNLFTWPRVRTTCTCARVLVRVTCARPCAPPWSDATLIMCTMPCTYSLAHYHHDHMCVCVPNKRISCVCAIYISTISTLFCSSIILSASRGRSGNEWIVTVTTTAALQNPRKLVCSELGGRTTSDDDRGGQWAMKFTWNWKPLSCVYCMCVCMCAVDKCLFMRSSSLWHLTTGAHEWCNCIFIS